jgi:hypothetical protein
MASILRSGAPRSILRSLNTTNSTFKLKSGPVQTQLRSRLCTISQRPGSAPLALSTANRTLALVRWQSTDQRQPVDQINAEREGRIMEKTMAAHPERVSATSTNPTMTAIKGSDEDDTKMLSGIYSDLVCQHYSLGTNSEPSSPVPKCKLTLQ